MSLADIYPLLPLRDLVLFPGMIVPLVVGRERSVLALEQAMKDQKQVFLLTQKNSTVDDPVAKDLYSMGTLGTVIQLLHLPEGTVKALVEGKKRAKVLSVFEPFSGDQACASVRVAEVEEEGLDDVAQLAAYMRELRAAFEEYGQTAKKLPKEVLKSILSQENPARMVDMLCAHLAVKSSDKQEILEILSVPDRMQRVLETLYREIELFTLERDINARVKKKMGEVQRNFYLAEKVRAIHEEMGQGEGGDDLVELEEAISKKKFPANVQKRAEKELRRLKTMPPMSAETTVVRNYLDALISLPWGKKSRRRLDINQAEAVLAEDHYGLDKPKERILEYLAVQSQVKKMKGPILCLVGPPGVGKTSVCRSIARAIGCEFVRISLGGVHDEAEIRGHRRTYVGAMPGKIILAMQRAGVVNPVFCLDEVDKMSNDFRGDPASALLEVLDPEQNSAFNDHYLDLDYDLSQVFFITTANHLHGIPAPLQDRMEIIELRGYTEEEKLEIALRFLVPKQLEANGFQKGDIVVAPEALLEIIRSYTREAGVRSLERTIGSLCRKVARNRLKAKELQKKYIIEAADITEYLGVAKYRYGLAEKQDKIGLSTGMAWTEMGGELLQIEATVLPGTGKLSITGKLGEVMQESAQAALSYVRSRAEALGIDAETFQKSDIHVHVPEGAIPKDGPSAGITIATAIVSALLKCPVRKNIAMTGEITLRGRVLPIGGLTEKLLAARRGNISHVLIPKDNERNLKDVPVKIRDSLDIELMEEVDEVLARAIIIKGGETLFKEAPSSPLFVGCTFPEQETNVRQ